MEINTAFNPFYPQAAQPQRREGNEGQAADTEAGDGARKLGEAKEFSTAELRQIEQLKRRDQEVKAHELAHKSTAGPYASGAPSFDYQIGPDGKRYAVGGEVSIDISKESDPERTLEKAQVIRRAAMAPANPSSQDRQIAMRAATMAAEARQEILLRENSTSPLQSSEDGQGDSGSAETQAETPTGRRRALASLNRVIHTQDQTSHQALHLIA